MLSKCAQLFEEKDYCDQSQLLMEEYRRLNIVEFSQELQFIDKWAADQSKSCLHITGHQRSGKKTLIFEWLQRAKELNSNWVFISHFASVTPIYSNILYKIMIELRNYFKIEQKVDLNEQKLRRYFKYWLDVTSDFLQKEYLGYQKQQVPKVVILIQAIDLCVDSRGMPVDPQFWLPSHIPSNIKLILTSKNSDAQFVTNCDVLRHQLSSKKKEKIVGSFDSKIQKMVQDNKQISLEFLVFLSKMVKNRPELELKGSFCDILELYITSVSRGQLTVQIIKSLLFTLILTRKGLTSKQLSKMVGIHPQKWVEFYEYFGFAMVQSQGYFIICNKSMQNVIDQMIDPSRQKIKTYRHSIVKCIRKESIKLRDLEEVVYQLLLSESYGELKEVISRVQNFIMLYTPLSKQLLCQCWSRLEQIQQFDPVYQYNKAIQAYTSHYYPKEEDLYKIIFQICVFFKQYAEFQNPKTPAFRHPLIKGEVDVLESIGIYEELKGLQMIGKCKTSKLKPLQKSDVTFIGNYSKISSSQTKQSGVKLIKQLEKKSRMVKSRQDEDARLGLRSSQKGSQRLIQEEISEQHQEIDNIRYSSAFEQNGVFNVEELNVAIQSNQQKFRQHFLGEMKPYLQSYFVPLKKNSYKDNKYLSFEGQDSDHEDESVVEKGDKQFKVDVQKMHSSFILKQFKEYLQESYHKTGEQMQYYYYKQWIWLQFPWLCQTIKHSYSKMLSQCLPGSIHFMSPSKQFHLIKDVIKIARSAKQNKLGIYNDKQVEVLSIRLKVKKNNDGKTQRQTKRQEKSNKKAQNMSQIRKFAEDASRSYRLDTTRLDQQILKERQEEFKIKGNKEKRLKGDMSMPNLNLFMTETNEKSTSILPVLQKSKFVVDRSRKTREKENIQDSRDYTLVIRKYNQLKHENDMLVQKIQEARRLQQKMGDRSQQQLVVVSERMQEYELKKTQIQRNYRNQLQLGKKLEMIIKICDLNKMYGSQSENLSNYLSNMKKMIQYEENKIKDLKDHIQKEINAGKVTVRELKNKRKEAKNQRQHRTMPYNALATDSTNIRCTQLGLSQIENELKEMNKSIKQKSKKVKSLKEKRYFSAKDYQLLEEKIGIQYGSSLNQDKIQQFARKHQKLKVLKVQNQDLKKELQKRSKELDIVRSQPNTQWQGEVRQRQIRTANLLVEKRKKLSQIKKRNLLLEHAIQSLDL